MPPDAAPPLFDPSHAGVAYTEDYDKGYPVYRTSDDGRTWQRWSSGDVIARQGAAIVLIAQQ